MSKPYILLDLDGVLADFFNGVFDIFGQNLSSYTADLPHEYNVPKWLGVSNEEMWARINETVNFWGYLAPYEWYEDLYAICASYGEVIISSSPSQDPNAFTQKANWIKNHLPQHDLRNVMIGHHKHLMANPGHILIDDCEENCHKFEQEGGVAIRFPQNWNTSYMSIDERIEFVRRELQQLTKE